MIGANLTGIFEVTQRLVELFHLVETGAALIQIIGLILWLLGKFGAAAVLFDCGIVIV